MNKRILILVVTIFLLIGTSPAYADVTLSINGKSYFPLTPAYLENGVTMIGLDNVSRVMGGTVLIDGDLYVLSKNDIKLELMVGQTTAKLNGRTYNLAAAPKMVDEEVMVPLRSVMEALGAEVEWQPQTRTVAVTYLETRKGMTPKEVMLKSNQVLTEHNTYKIRAELLEKADTGIPDQSLKNFRVLDLAVQRNPVLAHAKTSVRVEDPSPHLETSSSELIIDERVITYEGEFYTVPNFERWVKDISGKDNQNLLEAFLQFYEPMKNIKRLCDAGAIISFADDCIIDEQECWTVRVVREHGREQFYDKQQAASEYVRCTAEVYDIFINQSSFELLSIKSELTSLSHWQDTGIQTKTETTGYYYIYDLDQPVTVPDVSDYITKDDYRQIILAPGVPDDIKEMLLTD